MLNIAGAAEKAPSSIDRLPASIGVGVSVLPKPTHDAPREGDIRLTEAVVSPARDLFRLFRVPGGIDGGILMTVTLIRTTCR